MSLQKSILCIIEPDRRGFEVLQLAWQQAQRQGAYLIAAHIVDALSSFEADGIPSLTPQQLCVALAEAATDRINIMLAELRATAQLIVAIGPSQSTALHLALTSQADLVMVGAHSPFGLVALQGVTHYPFSVMTVAVQRHWNPLQRLSLSAFRPAKRKLKLLPLPHQPV